VFTPSRYAPVGVLGCVAFVLIGWAALTLPALIRSIRDQFGQDDAGIGALYLLYAVAYASGSLVGGILVERAGRRVVLVAGPLLLSGGLVAMALAPGWGIFLAATLPMGLGIGAVDGGVNGLFLDAFREGRGRALNTLHVFFSLGALGSPLVMGQLVERGVAWESILVATAIASLPVAALFAVLAMPTGLRSPATDTRDTAASPAASPAALGGLGVPIVLLAVAIGFYVAGQAGVTNWLVRFLEPAPLDIATLTLSLYWAGLTVGRIVSVRVADRFDHVRFTSVALLLLAAAWLAAIAVPSLPARMALFTLAGFASAPIYPMLMVIAGDRYPDRSGAVSGVLATSAIAGSIVYPPLMGFLSVVVGLQVAMVGAALLLLVSVGALVAVGRQPRPASTGAGVAVSEPAR
jgi:fucose permease